MKPWQHSLRPEPRRDGAFCVNLTPSQWEALQRTGDPLQTIRIAVMAYPEDACLAEEYRDHKLGVWMPEKLGQKVRRIAHRCNVTYAAVVRAAVRHYFENVAGKE